MLCRPRSHTTGSGETRILTFTWNTTGIPPGTYYIDARAPPVAGELDTNDNACKSTATVTIKRVPVGGEIVDTDEEINGYLKPIIIAGAMLTALAILGLAVTLKLQRTKSKDKVAA
jgi:hypothetical protein